MSNSNASPPKTGWSRLRNTVRRASTVIGSPKPPSISDKDNDSASLKSTTRSSSLKNIATSLFPSALSRDVAALSAPSPIAESPAREYAATHSGRVTSPLSHPENVTSSPPPSQPDADVATIAPAVTPAIEPIPLSPQEYTPPPVIDSTATGPGGFTDNTDDLPPSQLVDDPFTLPRIPTPVQAVARVEEGSAPQILDPVVRELDSRLGSRLETALAASSDRSLVPTEPVTPNTEDEPEPEPVQLYVDPETGSAWPFPPIAPSPSSGILESAAEDVVPSRVPAQEYADTLTPEPVYSDFPTPPSRSPSTQEIVIPIVHASPEHVPYLTDESLGGTSAIAPGQVYSSVPAFRNFENPGTASRALPIVADSATAAAGVIPQSRHDRGVSVETIFPLPIPLSMPGFEVDTGHDVWGGIHGSKHDRGLRSEGAARTAFSNPFADPITPIITVTPSDAGSPSIPEPQVRFPPNPVSHQVSPTSRSTNNDAYQQRSPVETDESTPLLARSRSQKSTSLHPPGNVTPYGVSLSPPNDTQHPLSGASFSAATLRGGALQNGITETTGRLQDLGWIGYQLPDGVTYFVHPMRRILTDIDLRDSRWLDAIAAYVERHVGGPGAGSRRGSSSGSRLGTSTGTPVPVPVGMELWVKEGAFTKRGTFVPNNYWVDHTRRLALQDKAETKAAVTFAGKKKKGMEEEDHLDQECRYWSFVESHPAHTTLSPTARAEALDVLSWAWTDQLLPSQRSSPFPFSPDECQELSSLVRSFGSQQNDFGLQSVMHTRIIARILLRVVHWRQQLHRPNRPFPVDITANTDNHRHLRRLRHRRGPLAYMRTVFDVIVACFCLGIPYFLYTSGRHRSGATFRFVDEESSSLRGIVAPGPMLILGACTCLVAAIVLSASVTFLSLSGLDYYARLAGLVAILCASFSVTSTGVAVFKYKAELDRPSGTTNTGVEGLMLFSRRSFVLSLPLVFLAYAIIAFVTAVVIYFVRGVSTAVTVLPASRTFYEYAAKWSTVAGAVGGVAGVFCASFLL